MFDTRFLCPQLLVSSLPALICLVAGRLEVIAPVLLQERPATAALHLQLAFRPVPRPALLASKHEMADSGVMARRFAMSSEMPSQAPRPRTTKISWTSWITDCKQGLP